MDTVNAVGCLSEMKQWFKLNLGVILFLFAYSIFSYLFTCTLVSLNQIYLICMGCSTQVSAKARWIDIKVKIINLDEMWWLFPSVYLLTAYQIQVHVDAGTFPSFYWAKGWGHSGQVTRGVISIMMCFTNSFSRQETNTEHWKRISLYICSPVMYSVFSLGILMLV